MQLIYYRRQESICLSLIYLWYTQGGCSLLLYYILCIWLTTAYQTWQKTASQRHSLGPSALSDTSHLPPWICGEYLDLDSIPSYGTTKPYSDPLSVEVLLPPYERVAKSDDWPGLGNLCDPVLGEAANFGRHQVWSAHRCLHFLYQGSSWSKHLSCQNSLLLSCFQVYMFH